MVLGRNEDIWSSDGPRSVLGARSPANNRRRIDEDTLIFPILRSVPQKGSALTSFPPTDGADPDTITDLPISLPRVGHGPVTSSDSNYANITLLLPIVRTPVQVITSTPRDSQQATMSARRLPAPLGLRLCVLGLSVGLLCALAGIAAERMKPQWFAGLRNQVVVSAGAGQRARAVLPPPPTERFHLLSSSAQMVKYLVPRRDYSLVVVVNKPVWYRVTSPDNSGTPLVQGIELPSQSPLKLSVKGSTSIMVAAKTISITVMDGSITLGSISLPHAGVVYDFEPSARDYPPG